MTPEQIVEATLFASQTPLTPNEIARADGALDVVTVRDALQTLRTRYDDQSNAFQVYQLGDGYQILTRPEFAPYLERFDSVPRPPTLSRAALETLAIIAYRQPIGRIDIEEIRGVATASVLRTLSDWELIRVTGRGEGLGRPLLYGTTAEFLDHFGFQSLRELPEPEELPIALRNAIPGTGEEQLPLGAVAETGGEDEEARTPAESEGAVNAAPENRLAGEPESDGVGTGEEPSSNGTGNGTGPTNGTGPDGSVGPETDGSR
ncbi:MAG: SMC-Scp complex subunit ScpB [Gemmatimonadota bacterium]|nr:SMC-Scp complex subunit ScpB [Gemmatimonadota bacterium]